MSARVAFVVPAFNAAATLGDTLQSLLEQTERHWRAIIIDDGSTDATAAAALRPGDPRIEVRSQDNRGLAGARNAGLARVDAELVCFLDADDRVSPTFVEKMTLAIEDSDLAPAAYRMVGEGLEDLDWTITPADHDLAPDRLVHVNPLAVGAVLVRIPAMRGLGMLGDDGRLFDESLPAAEDWDLWLRASAAGARWAPVVSEPMLDYRLREGAMTGSIAAMHAAGARVIGASSAPGCASALRGWSIRNAARAVAAGDRNLAMELLGPTLPLADSDIGVLVGALRHAFMFADRVGPSRAAARWDLWRERISAALCDLEELPAVLQRLSVDADRFRVAAAALVATLGPGQTPVVYGMGRNGRAFVEALRALRPNVAPAWIDDHRGAGCEPPARRMDAAGLTTSHVVVVTPEECSGILESLGGRGVRVETISSLTSRQLA